MTVAKNIAWLRPLPLPPFHALTDLSSDQLRNLCIRHLKSSENLESAEPTVIGSAVVPLAYEPDNCVLFFSVFHGGRYALILYRDGLVQLWDLDCKDTDIPPRPLEGCDVRVQGYGPPQTGRLLATHHMNTMPDCYDYEARSDGEIVIAAFSLVV